MLHRNLHRNEHGVTLIELVIVISLASIIGIIAFGFFGKSYSQYISLQTDAIKFNDLSIQAQRVAKVLRGSTDVLEATNTAVTVYAYFTPRDAVVSKIRYYNDTATTSILADVTPMSAAPPQGLPLTAQKQTYTIVENVYVASGVNIFEYLNSVGGTLSSVANLHDVKGIRFSLAVPATLGTTAKNTTITSEVALRNRKTNL